MKTFIVYLILLFFTITPIVCAAEEPVPPTPLTSAEVEKITRDEGKKTVTEIEKLNKQLLEKKDAKTAKAIDGFSKKFGVFDRITEKIDGLTSKDGFLAKIGDETKNIGETINRKTRILVGAIAVSMILIIIAMLFLSRRNRRHENKLQKEVIDLVREVGKKVDEVPTKTAEEVKKLEEAVLIFEVLGHKVSYKPRIENEAYLSLFVPEEAEIKSNPSEIDRIHTDKKYKVRDSAKSLMKRYLAGEFANRDDSQAKMQVALIEYLQKTGELKIEPLNVEKLKVEKAA